MDFCKTEQVNYNGMVDTFDNFKRTTFTSMAGFNGLQSMGIENNQLEDFAKIQIFEDYKYVEALDKLKLKYFTGVYEGPEMMRQKMANILEDLEVRYELEIGFRESQGIQNEVPEQ